jgi:uncharacterized membrane protein
METSLQDRRSGTNMSTLERSLSIAGGIALAAAGFKSRGAWRLPLALFGGELVRRGVTGHCYMYERFGQSPTGDSTRQALSGSGGVHVEESVRIHQPVQTVYEFWRNLENLPRVMSHLDSVEVLDSRRSHWIAKAPAGTTVEWDAEIINEEENRLIGWRSIGDKDIYTAGSVRFFERGPNGTEIRVRLQYQPPAGKLGAMIASILGQEPSQQIREDLQRLKRTLEAGQAAGF